VSTIIMEHREEIGILRLNNGPTNVIGPDLLNDLEDALAVARRECRGLVLAGGAKFFSMGLDLPSLIPLTRDVMSDFFYRFNQAVLHLYTLPVPTCCAVAGHAVAGGCVLALGCDFRFAAPEKKLGLNEIRLGVPVPYLADMILRQITGDRAATSLIYGGDFIVAADAVPSGLVDAVFSQENVAAEALGKVSAIASHHLAAFAEIKKNRVEVIQRHYEQDYKAKNEAFLDCWFSAPVRRLLEEAARKF